MNPMTFGNMTHPNKGHFPKVDGKLASLYQKNCQNKANAYVCILLEFDFFGAAIDDQIPNGPLGPIRPGTIFAHFL